MEADMNTRTYSIHHLFKKNQKANKNKDLSYT